MGSGTWRQAGETSLGEDAGILHSEPACQARVWAESSRNPEIREKSTEHLGGNSRDAPHSSKDGNSSLSSVVSAQLKRQLSLPVFADRSLTPVTSPHTVGSTQGLFQIHMGRPARTAFPSQPYLMRANDFRMAPSTPLADS